MTPFLASLAHDDLAPTTLRGYRYDLRHFLAWHRTVQDSPFTIEGLTEYELIAYRQHMVAAGRRPAEHAGDQAGEQAPRAASRRQAARSAASPAERSRRRREPHALARGDRSAIGCYRRRWSRTRRRS